MPAVSPGAAHVIGEKIGLAHPRARLTVVEGRATPARRSKGLLVVHALRSISPLGLKGPPRPVDAPRMQGYVRSSSHDRFLDVLRAVAVVRVVSWHAFGAPFITYLVAAVPAMFFVTGSLLQRSFSVHGIRATVGDRLRRILVPLWVFTGVAFTVMYGAYRRNPSDITAVPWRSGLAWVLPIVDPHGSTWESGWMSSPLWYLRTLVWLIALAPILFWAARRWPIKTLAGLGAGVIMADAIGRWDESLLYTTRVPWLAGGVCLYSFFFVLGHLYQEGRLAHINNETWAAGGVLAVAAAVAWTATNPIPDGVVNDSHPAHLMIGMAWLCTFLALKPLIERAAANAGVARLVQTVNRRSLTIYLWHSSAIILSYQLLWRTNARLPFGMFNAALLALTVTLTTAFVAIFGAFEDLAARRRVQSWPTVSTRVVPRGLPGVSTAAAVGAIGLLLAVTVVANASSDGGYQIAASARASSTPDGARSATQNGALGLAQPGSHNPVRIPSQSPPTPQASRGRPPTSVPAAGAGAAGVASAAQVLDKVELRPPKPLYDSNPQLVAIAEQWRTRYGVSGVQFAVSTVDGGSYKGATGSLGADEPIAIWSITKTFTALLVFRLIDQGRLQLDEPLPSLTGAPDFDASRFTVRQLLSHQSGLVNYADTPQYAADASLVSSPRSAVMAAGAQPLEFEPGSASRYVSTNYLVLGLLLEQVVGKPFETQVREEILNKLGFLHTSTTPPGPGRPNFSTGGVVSNLDELLTWTASYFRTHDGISESTAALMTDIDKNGLGVGSIGFCPCSDGADGRIEFSSYGYYGSTTVVQYTPASGTVIVINLSDSFWTSTEQYQAVTVFLAEELRAAVG